MKLLLPIFLACSLSGVSSAATTLPSNLFAFTQNGNQVVVTVTSDISIPITVAGHQDSIVFVLEDAYASPQAFTSDPPATSYSGAGAIQASLQIMGSGTTVAASDYGNQGAFAATLGEVDPNDFYGSFVISQDLAVGDIFTIKAGTAVMRLGTTPILLPNLTPTSIILTDRFGSPVSEAVALVPEPSGPAVGSFLGLGLLARRRRA